MIEQLWARTPFIKASLGPPLCRIGSRDPGLHRAGTGEIVRLNKHPRRRLVDLISIDLRRIQSGRNRFGYPCGLRRLIR
jgi:hypothetical protein